MQRRRGGSPTGGSAGCVGLVRVVVPALLALVMWASEGATDPSFLPGGAYATGNRPGHMASADFNRDGIQDIAVANTAATTVSVLLGNGTGGFLTKTDHGVNVPPGFVTTGDLNNDGNPDIVVALPTMNFIHSIVGRGDGTFMPAALTYTHSYTLTVALGRFDNDGNLDVAFGEAEYSALDVFRGNGNGGFSWVGHTVLGGPPTCVIAHDLTNDGWPDLIAVKTSSNTFVTLVGHGDATFANLGETATGTSPAHAAVGDLNQDGNADVVVANSGSNTVSVFLGTGTGTLGARQDFATGTTPRFVSIADLDANGVVDLAVANSGSNTVSVLVGNGDGTFSAPLDFRVGAAPMSVLAMDVSSDGRLDLVCANSVDNTVSVLLQQPSLPTTTTSLAGTPNPSIVGQAVTLTATVVPAATSGTARFYDGTTPLGEAPVSAGTATFEATSLSHRSHGLWACFLGNAEYAGSCSPVVEQTVDLAQTLTVVRAASDSLYFRLPCRFVADVTPVPPGGGQPAGTVRFLVDGEQLGTPAPLSACSATSAATATLSVGEHQVEAVYIPADTLYYAGSYSAPTFHVVRVSNPRIVKVRDVPNDQGGHVFVTWNCPLDQPGFDIVKGYRVWRRVPYLALSSDAPARDLQRLMVTGGESAVADSSGGEVFWEALAELPAARLVSYGFTAPTTQDSIAGSNPYTAFVVQALTADATEFFGSGVDSGYSVDNLSPPAPAPFAVVYLSQSNVLHWAANPAADFREFRLYRGTNVTFVPGPTNLVAATSDTTYVDLPGTVFYKLIAVDIHGNESRAMLASPESPVALLAALVQVDALADRISLLWYTAGSGALDATVYRREGIEDWVAMGRISADGTGYLRYTDTDVVPGVRYGYRLGIWDGESEVFVGEAWATPEEPQLRLAGARPNPASGSRLNVEFTLRSGQPATLRLFDVSGRQVSSADVSGLGPGRHRVDLAAGARVRPGLYLVRLTQGEDALVARVVVVD